MRLIALVLLLLQPLNSLTNDFNLIYSGDFI